jgi:hypothetical protein
MFLSPSQQKMIQDLTEFEVLIQNGEKIKIKMTKLIQNNI